MKFGEIARPTATWRFVVRDARTGAVLKAWEQKNVLTTVVKNYFAQAYGNGAFQHDYGSGDVRYHWYLVLGTGTGTPSESDTGLFNAVPSSAKTGTITVNNNTVQFYVRYMPEDANGYTYTEAGIYDHCTQDTGDPSSDYTSGQLINHLLIDPSVTKDNTILLDVYVTITFP